MEKIVIAKVLKPQGVKGELKCKPLTDEEFFSNLKEVFISDQAYNVISLSYRFGYVYITISGCNSRNDAEAYRNLIVMADRSIAGDALLVSDLENCSIYDEQQNFVGKVISVENYGATDILNIEETSGRQVSLPFLDSIFLSVNAKLKTIVCNKELYKANRVEE